MARVRLPRVVVLSAVLLGAPVAVTVHTIAQAPAAAGDVTFTKDIAPVLQRSCQECHHADGGAPRGNPADMPKPLNFDDSDKWTIGEPDLVLKSKEVLVPASGPDWWGDVGLIPTGLTEDRYVSAVEVREVNDIPRSGGTKTVGGRYVFHHMTYSSIVPGQRDSASAEETATTWPIHEVGRNADIFPPEAGRLLAANSSLSLTAGHIHPNGRETKAHLEFGFKFFPKGYKPLFRRST